jgi:uncharacterized protein with HEPN domain
MTRATRDVKLYLADILESIEAIQDYTRHSTEDGFYHNRMLQDAVIRRLEIIGEAVNHIPQRLRAKHPGIPWQDIVGMRNRLTHEYFGVQLHRAWKVVQEDLVPLRETVQRMIDGLPQV